MYIVVDEKGKPLELCLREDLPGGWVLIHGDRATCFKTYQKASAAKRRSRVFEERNNYAWGCKMWRLMKLIDGP